jgi:ribonuclease HI
MSARKLRHCFKAQAIKVLTNQPLNDIFGNGDSTKRISKWVMELSEHVIDFKKHNAIKSQILVDFVAEWMEPGSATKGAVLKSPWQVYCDGALGTVGARAPAILISPPGIKLRYAARLQLNNEADKCTNNIAEYEAILLGLRKLRAIRIQRCTLRTDSKVVAGQIEKECIAREPTLERYLALVRRMENYFKGFTVEYIERAKNTEADELAKAAARNTPLPADVFLQVILDASIKIVEPNLRVINLIQDEDWCAPIMAYLRHYYEPNSIIEHIRMQQRARSYQIVDNDLYKTSVSCPLLRCVSKAEGQEILSKIHAGTCGGHIGARALAAKVLQQGFYCPIVMDDAGKLISTCEAYQKISHKSKAPAQPVHLIAPSWPLQRWGIDIVGKLTPAQGNYTFTVVAVEYFTKWAEVKPLTNVSSASIKKFFW